MNDSKARTREFFARPADRVAMDLLGDVLLCETEGEITGGTIMETEAYVSDNDDANHALQSGKTERNQAMFGPPGTVYVYLIYGMYHCLNIVCQKKQVPEAVLIRGVRPEIGTGCMIARREKQRKSQVPRDEIASGPGNLCTALAIDRSVDQTNVLSGSPVTVEKGPSVPEDRIVKGPRVGVEYADMAGDWPLRFQMRETGDK